MAGGRDRHTWLWAGHFGLAVTVTSPNRGEAPWLGWAALAVLLTAASGAVFGYGLARWPELTALGSVGRTEVVRYLTRIYAAGTGMFVLGAFLGVADGGVAGVRAGWRGMLLVGLAGLAALPVGAGLAAIRKHARALSGTTGEQVEAILALRQPLAGLLAALGVQVTLATLALGAAIQLDPAGPPAVVIQFGAAYSAVIAIAYVPAAGALRMAARRLCHAVVPLANVTAADLPARTDERRRLEQALGVERGMLADIQSGIIVLSPLVASAASLFLPT